NFTFKYEEVIKVDRGIDLGFKTIRVGGDRSTRTEPALDSRAEAVKLQINSIGLGELVSVSLIKGETYYGGKFYGLINRISDSDFEVIDFTHQVTFSIRYSDVKKVERDRNHGKRLLAIITAMSVGTVIAAMLISRKSTDQKFPQLPSPFPRP